MATDYSTYVEDTLRSMEEASKEGKAEEYKSRVETSTKDPFGGAYGKAFKFLLDAPENVTVGTMRGAYNMVKTADDMFEAAGEVVTSGLEGSENETLQNVSQAKPVPPLQTMFPGAFEAMDSFFAEVDNEASGSDALVQGMSQFVVPFAGYLKAMHGLKNSTNLAKAGKVLGAEAAAAGSAFDPQEGRVADLIALGKETENRFAKTLNMIAPDESLLNSYINYLTNREGESKWEGRWKNAVDSVSTTVSMAGVLKAVPATLRLSRKALEKMGTGPLPGSRKAQRGSIDFSSPDELTDIERAKALKNTVVEEVDGEHIVLEGDNLNKNADVVSIKKDKK